MAVVRFYAAARDAAGVVQASVPADSTGQLRQELTEQFGEPMERVLSIASLLVDGRQVTGDADVALGDASTVDVLPPFAGGAD
jgi:sulfur-carrier protein